MVLINLETLEKLVFADIVLNLSKNNLDVNDIVSKVKRLLNEEILERLERLQFLVKVNGKIKHKAADLIEIY
ncbi:19863_t:CDS:2 [Gigaspora margarita]|uniref:19863_t:CDS:1 n=1 Tax=Gigaspora margarita TaxID=4874 RepID=A0ABN7UZB2_GIGMA|nr:19863_t:CDS:2 [Gigaspora margarita]